MRQFLQSRSLGGPQFLAAGLLLIYLLECMWLVRIESQHGPRVNSDRDSRIYYGLQQWTSGAVAGTPDSLLSAAPTWVPPQDTGKHIRARDGFDQDRSPLYYLIAAAPMLIRPASWNPSLPFWHLLAAAPYLFFGVMLGGSLWYVARRLYGNAGGFIALGLYCFSPAMIVNVAGPHHFGEIGGTWGVFGVIWTAIAVAHTLYAPREVVLWNWRRILLLGLSIALAVGHQFSLAILVLVVLLLMLWVAPIRKAAVLVIWGAACLVGALLLFAAYFFHFGLFWQGMLHARWIDFDPRSLTVAVSYRFVADQLLHGSPALAATLAVAVVAFAVWKRVRYFGNIAPLAVAVLLLVLGTAAPAFPGEGFSLAWLIFLFVFVAGVFADLIETRRGPMVAAALTGLLVASAFWNILQLAVAR